MIRWLQIPTAVVLLALLANPVEGHEGNDDLGTGVSWRRAVLNAIQAACAEKSTSLCPTPDRPTASDSTRTAPASSPRTVGRGGPAPAGVQWGAYVEFGTFDFDPLDLYSATGTRSVFVGSELVDEQTIDNLDSLNSNYYFTSLGHTATFGAWARGRPKDSGLSVEARIGLQFADIEVEYKEKAGNRIITTTGEDWGATGAARFDFRPKADEPFFAWTEVSAILLDIDAERGSPEVVPGAIPLLDTSHLDFTLINLTGGVGWFLGADGNYSVRAGLAFQHLNIGIVRYLHLEFPAVNQLHEWKFLTDFDKNAFAVHGSAEARPSDRIAFRAALLVGPGVRRAIASAGLRF